MKFTFDYTIPGQNQVKSRIADLVDFTILFNVLSIVDMLQQRNDEAPEAFMSENQHRVAKAVEAVPLSDGFAVGPGDNIFTGKGG